LDKFPEDRGPQMLFVLEHLWATNMGRAICWVGGNVSICDCIMNVFTCVFKCSTFPPLRTLSLQTWKIEVSNYVLSLK
jgi:hypothetical protein